MSPVSVAEDHVGEQSIGLDLIYCVFASHPVAIGSSICPYIRADFVDQDHLERFELLTGDRD